MNCRGRVISVCGEYAVVETQRKSACEGCHKKTDGGCTACSLMGKNSVISTKAKNIAGAKIGDTVEIESKTSTMMFYAFLIFILPIIIALAAYFISKKLTTEGVSLIISLIGFVISYIGVIIYSDYVKKHRCDTAVTKIIN